MRKTQEYFLTNSGFCLKLPMTKYGRVDKWPYKKKEMMRCPFKLGHPHGSNIIKTLNRIYFVVFDKSGKILYSGFQYESRIEKMQLKKGEIQRLVNIWCGKQNV